MKTIWKQLSEWGRSCGVCRMLECYRHEHKGPQTLKELDTHLDTSYLLMVAQWLVQ